MGLPLLNELQTLLHEEKTSQKTDLVLLERADKLLGHLQSVLNHSDEGLNDYDADELATQMAGLQILGKKDYREVMDDFAKVDTHGVSKQFFKFIDQVDDPRQSKDFLDKRSADDLLTYVATTHGQSVIDSWKKAIEAAQNGDKKSLIQIKDNVAKMFKWYTGQYGALKAHFKVGGAFDDLITKEDPAPEVK